MVSLVSKALLVVVVLFGLACVRRIDRELVDAATEGDAARVETLLEGGADIEAHANDGWTALAVASREGHLKTVELLLFRGAQVNAREGGGHTPLFWAERYNRSEVASVLRRAGGESE